jgi:hypothetical protein
MGWGKNISFDKISTNLQLHEDKYIFVVQSTLQMPMY